MREDVADDWSQGWLCNGCGHSLGLPSWKWETGELDPLYEGRTDSDGDFFRCLYCGGKNYYELDENQGAHFRYFKPGARLFYRWRRKLGLLGPDNDD